MAVLINKQSLEGWSLEIDRKEDGLYAFMKGNRDTKPKLQVFSGA